MSTALRSRSKKLEKSFKKVLTSNQQHDIINISNNKREVNNMTKLTFIWTSNNGTSIELSSYTEALERVKKFGGSFVSKYTERKDVDYCTPNPKLKSFKNRLVAC